VTVGGIGSGRKPAGTGGTAIANHIKEFYPHLVDEAIAYNAKRLQEHAAAIRAKRNAAEAAKIEGELAALQAKLDRLRGVPQADAAPTADENGAGTYERMEALGAVVLR
jgi:hypothetical protein